MAFCPECGNEVTEGKFCGNCGEELPQDNTTSNTNKIENNFEVKRVGNEYSTSFNENDTNNENTFKQEYKASPTTQSFNQNNNQNTYNQQYDQQARQSYENYRQTRPVNEKNKILAVALAFFVPGLGYGYLNKWKEGAIIFIAIIILNSLSYSITSLIAFALWIYSMYKTYMMVDEYNEGKLI